jgi:hypothetical protein
MGLSVETLLFIDEVDLDELFSRGRLEMVLVDHNRLARSQEHLSRSIVEIVDHHEPEDLYPWVEDRLIEQVSGNCRIPPSSELSDALPQHLFKSTAASISGRGICKSFRGITGRVILSAMGPLLIQGSVCLNSGSVLPLTFLSQF